jgi:hypothetical protein
MLSAALFLHAERNLEISDEFFIRQTLKRVVRSAIELKAAAQQSGLSIVYLNEDPRDTNWPHAVLRPVAKTQTVLGIHPYEIRLIGTTAHEQSPDREQPGLPQASPLYSRGRLKRVARSNRFLAQAARRAL